MAALIHGAGQHVANQAYLQERSFAHWVAMNRLAEVQVQKEPLPTGRSEGSETMGGRDWRWAMEVEKTPDTNILRIHIEVRPEQEVHDSSYAQLIGYRELLP
jgi:general secretion pathway protein I